MQRRPQTLKEALFPHFMMYAIIGHGIFHSPSGQPRPVCSMIYAGVMTCLYFAVLYLTISYMTGQDWFDKYDRLLLLVVFLNVAIIMIGVFLSWCSSEMPNMIFTFDMLREYTREAADIDCQGVEQLTYGRSSFPNPKLLTHIQEKLTRIVEDLTKVDETLRELGATFDYAGTRNEGYFVILIGIIIVFSLNFIDVLWLADVEPIFQIFLVTSVLHCPAHASTLVVTNFCMEFRLVRTRYIEANTILEAMKRRCCYQPVSQASDRTRQLLRSVENHEPFVQIIKQVHLKLRGISRDLCKSYGVQLALNMASLFVMKTGFLYLLYAIATGPTDDPVDQRLRMLALGLWVAFYCIHLFLVNQACECICAEAHRTGEIIHCLSRDIVDPNLVSEISQFTLQLIHDPLCINPGEFICLGHKYVLHFVGTVTTYLMILIQVGEPKTGTRPG